MTFERFEVMDTESALENYASQISSERISESLKALLDSFDDTVKTVVVEKDYIDVDYSASYYEQRVRSFTPIDRGTTRLHFFTEAFSKRKIVNATSDTVQTMKSSYLGFTVIRPDWPTTLGRTFISCPPEVSGSAARFPTRSTISVDLAGIPLSVESCPYMSQDRKIMACATAALWMSTTPLSDKVSGISSHTTAEITGMAMSLARPFGPSIGRRGLTLFEMEQALLEIGFDPRIYPCPTKADLVEICHLSCDSGIPPVLLIESNGDGHAVTVIGYTLKPYDPTRFPVSPNSSAHQFVSDLIIHDDDRGMYLLAEVNTPAGYPTGVAELSIKVAGRTENATCTAILTPFPRRVMLDATDVERQQAEEWITLARERRWIEDRKVVYRTLLVGSNVFKQTLLERQDRGKNSNGYPRDFVTMARSLPMPRLVWLIEVSYWDDWDPGDPSSPPVIADFVFDSTSTETVRPDYLLLHFPGVALGRPVSGGTRGFVSEGVSDDHPHPPFPDIPRP